MQDPITFINIEYLFQVIYLILTGEQDVAFFSPLWNTITIIAYILTILFIVGSVYAAIRIRQIRKEDVEKYNLLVEEAVSAKVNVTDPRLDRMMSHLESINESDWRLAIIEADTLLDEIMTKMGYTQDTLGEKLKSVEKSDFTNIDKAWEAHKVRNSIAHEGSTFLLTKREAERVINLYRDIFQEFEVL